MREVNQEPLDAGNVARRLWVGSRPPLDRDLPQFDILALCAQEIQPQRTAFHGTIIRCPIPDDYLTDDQLALAKSTGKEVAKQLVSGKTILVTCSAGINRSAFVAGLALGLVTRMSGDQIIALMRARRNPDCLHNPFFRQQLQLLIPGRKPASGWPERTG